MILIVLLVLLVPIRYDIKARVEEKTIRAKVRVSWLLRLVQVLFDWREKSGLFRVKILGFRVMGRTFGAPAGGAGKKKEEKEEAEEAPEEAPAPPVHEPSSWVDPWETPKASVIREETLPDEVQAPAVPEGETPPAHTAPADPAAPAQEGKTDGPAAATASDGAETEKKDGLLELLKSRFTAVRDFLDDAKNQETIALILKQLKRVGKHLIPTHFLTRGEFGLKNPAQTGRIVGWLYSLTPLYGDNIRVDGVYDRETVSVYLELGGRIRLGIFVSVAVRLLLNKNFRKWLKALLKKDKETSTDSSAAAESKETKTAQESGSRPEGEKAAENQSGREA